MTNDGCKFSNTASTYINMTIGSGTGMHVGLRIKYVTYMSWLGELWYVQMMWIGVNVKAVCIMMYVFYDYIRWMV